jgi:hypothetical protein
MNDSSYHSSQQNYNYYDYYKILDINSQILISDINQYVEQNQHRFFISRLGQNRLDFDWTITKQISEIFKFTISDAGVFKNPPGWVYPVHKDTRRQFAINLLLSDVDTDFEVNFHSDDLKFKFSIPYNKNQWILINTKKFHEVKNNSPSKDRYVVSIGCEKTSYYDIVDLI